MVEQTEVTRNAQKILARLKGLREHMRPDEIPLLNVPAIWDGGLPEQEGHATPVDVVVTNQRIIGYALKTFPRTHLFFDALELPRLTTISQRNKSYEPLFRELLLSDGKRKVYLRTPQKQVSQLVHTLRQAIVTYAPDAQAQVEETTDTPSASSGEVKAAAPVYGVQDIRTPFEGSLLAIVLLFIGGLVLEIVGAGAWAATGDAQVGLPLCIAGFLAFIFSIFVMRQRQP